MDMVSQAHLETEPDFHVALRNYFSCTVYKLTKLNKQKAKATNQQTDQLTIKAQNLNHHCTKMEVLSVCCEFHRGVFLPLEKVIAYIFELEPKPLWQDGVLHESCWRYK